MLKKLENLLKNEIDPAFAKRAEFIFQEIEDKKPRTILDAGCGRGFYLYAISLYDFVKEIHGIDINTQYIEKAKAVCNDKRIAIKKSNIYKLGYKNNYFDLIVFSEVLEHIGNEEKALTELKRVLKPGGTLVVTVPSYNFPFLWDPLNWIFMYFFRTHINKNIWWLAGIWADHERLYKTDELVRRIKERGFQIDKVKQVVHFCWPFSHFLLYGIGKNLIGKFGLDDFNRFNFSRKKTFSSLIAYIFKLPSQFSDNLLRNDNAVNICILAKK